MDRRYLTQIAVNYGGGPVGVETIAAALSEPRDAIEEIIEPFLIQQGFLQRTPRGRLLTGHAFRHLGLAEPHARSGAVRIVQSGGRGMSAPIRIVAALIRDEQGRVLLVRKRGTAAFMQPGGKRDPGEDDVTALARELDEELGCQVLPETFAALGTFECVAANEPDRQVNAAVYRVDVTGNDRGARRDRRDRLDRPRITAGYPSRAADARSRVAAGALAPCVSYGLL